MRGQLMIAMILLIVESSAFAQQQTNNVSGELKQKREFRYTNPITRDTSISMRDHCIIKVGNLWYCTGTSNPVWTGHNPGVRLLVSDDLIHWKQHSWIIDASKLSEDCPYNGRFWAPEIHYIKNKFYLTVNSGMVTKDDPEGMKTHNVWLFVLKFQDTEDPYCETGHNSLFEGPDGKLWSSCHYSMYENRPYPYSPTLQNWEKLPQMGIEPVFYKDGMFYIGKPSWTEQIFEY